MILLQYLVIAVSVAAILWYLVRPLVLVAMTLGTRL